MAFIPDSTPTDVQQPIAGAVKAGSSFTPDNPNAVVTQEIIPADLSQTDLGNIPDYETFKQQYIAQEAANPISKALEVAKSGISGAYEGIAKPLASGAVAGVEELGNDISNVSKNGLRSALAEALGNKVRTGLEGSRRAGFDILSTPGLIADKLKEALLKGQIPGNPANLLPRTPLEPEIQNAYQNLIKQNSMQISRNQPENQLISPDAALPGKVNERIANAQAAAIPLALPLVGAEERAALSVCNECSRCS